MRTTTEARGAIAGVALLATLLVCLLALGPSQVGVVEHNGSLDIVGVDVDVDADVPNADATRGMDASILDDIDLPPQHWSSLPCGDTGVQRVQRTAPAGIVGASILRTAPKTSPPSV